MTKRIEDYLHLYLGCKVQYVFTTRTDNQEKRIGILDGIKSNGAVNLGIVVSETHWDEYRLSKLTPILRPLSAMSEAEMGELLPKWFQPNEDTFKQLIFRTEFHTDELKRRIKHGEGVGYSLFKEDGSHYMTGTLSFTHLNSEQFLYLLKQGFDLFGLIDSKLAIDSTTLKSTKQ